jgi:hypothetical protein
MTKRYSVPTLGASKPCRFDRLSRPASSFSPRTTALPHKIETLAPRRRKPDICDRADLVLLAGFIAAIVCGAALWGATALGVTSLSLGQIGSTAFTIGAGTCAITAVTVTFLGRK